MLISGNLPFKTEVASVFVFSRIESDSTTAAAAVSVVLMADLVRDAVRHLLLGATGGEVMTAGRLSLRVIALGYLGLLLVVPIGMVFYRALENGIGPAWDAVTTPPAQHAFYLTCMIALVAVPLNAVFGVACAWLLARYEFRGKRLLDTIIDLPFAISPVVVGLALILVWGNDGWFASTSVIFSTPGMILATIFVSLPFVVREVEPVLREEGIDQEQAAATLGANGFQILRRITLPTIRWGLTYGIILSTARALGEFGAVAIVSGKISGPHGDADPVRRGPLPVARPRRRLRGRARARAHRRGGAHADDLPPATTQGTLTHGYRSPQRNQALRRLRRARRRQRRPCRTAR